jgi:hypothetical protein
MRSIFLLTVLIAMLSNCSKNKNFRVRCPDGNEIFGRVDTLPEYEGGSSGYGRAKDWNCLASTYVVFFNSGEARIDLPGKNCIANSVSFLNANGIAVESLDGLPKDIGKGISYKDGDPHLCQIHFFDWPRRLSDSLKLE